MNENKVRDAVWVLKRMNSDMVIYLGDAGVNIGATTECTVGIFLNEQEALQGIKEKGFQVAGGGYYKYLLLYPIKPGLDSIADDFTLEHWFKYNVDEERYEGIKCPVIGTRQCLFGY